MAYVPKKRVALGLDQLGELIDGIHVPEGFTKAVVQSEDKEEISISLTKPDDVWIRAELYNSPDEGLTGTGHTDFMNRGFRSTYDRRGIDDSFYVEGGASVAEIVECINREVREQLARIEKSRAHALASTPAPGLGHLLTPEQRAEIGKKLTRGGSHLFRPSGMGTAYEATTKRPRDRFGWKAADPKLSEYLGVKGPIYLIMHDYD